MSQDLYEQDFFAWTQAQAEALRARDRNSNAIEWERVAEEIEDMGKSQLHSLESLVVRIIQHLHYLRATRDKNPVRRWKREIEGWRAQLRRKITPTQSAALLAELDELHRLGAHEARRWAKEDEPWFDEIDLELRWSWEEIMGERDDPLQLYDQIPLS